MKNLIFVSLISLLISCKAKTEQKTEQSTTTSDTVASASTPTETIPDEALTFGFSNEAGTQILAFEENTNPATCTQVIDNQGLATPIKHIKQQKGNESGVNLVSQNISNCVGQLFEIGAGKKVNTNLSSVIVNDAFIKNRHAISIKTFENPVVIDAKTKSAIASERQRTIKIAWKVANLGENRNAYIVIFTPKKDSVLASLVIENTGFVYRDYPAKYDAGSTWRVDDGGEFPNDAIKILAAFINSKGELEIVTEWAGAEGANIEYAKENRKSFETIKEASRYWGAL